MLSMLAAACGYQLVRAGSVFGAARLSIEPFAETGPIGITGPMAAALPPRLSAVGIDVTPAPERADAVLSGRLSLLTYPGGTLSSVLLYNVDLVVAAELHDAAGALLWRHDCTLREHFLPPDPGTFPEPLTLETRRRIALARLAERAAAELAEALALAAHRQRQPADAAAGPSTVGAGPRAPWLRRRMHAEAREACELAIAGRLGFVESMRVAK